MEDSSGKKESLNLIAKIPDSLNKKIKYQQKDIVIKDLINIVYKLFYKNKGYPIATEDIVKELLDHGKAEKFGPKVMNIHLYYGYRNSKNLVSRIKINDRRYLFYPLALVLMTEGNTYDFTSTSNPLYKDSITLASEISNIFDANFEEISEKVTLNICEPSINLKKFLESYDREYHKDILEILIELVEPVKTEYVYSPKKYGSIIDLEKDVSDKLKERDLINPFSLPDYPQRLKQFVTENRSNELKKALTYLEKHRILLVSGVGGVGKSTLARALVDYRLKTISRPFWFNFNQNQDTKLNDILEKLASYLNAPDIVAFKSEKREPGKTDVDKLISELQRRKKIWLIFDDLSTVLEDQQFIDKGIELLFSSLRYNTHNAKIIMTSRILPILENGESLLDVVEEEEKQHLNGLKPIFAVNYLAKNGLAEVGLDKLEELAKGVDGHPLALKLLIELVKEFGAADILEDLNIYQEKKEDTIKKARRLFDKLAGNEKELLERVSVYREPVSIKGLKEMFTEKTSKYAVKKLIDKSLLETNHKGSYGLHPLIQEFSYKDLKNKKEVHKIAYNYYRSLLLPENPSKKEDLQPAIEAYYHACEAEEYDLAAQMILLRSKLHISLDNWGDYTTLEEMYRRLLPKEHFKDKALLSDKKMESLVFGKLGNVYLQLGKADIALNYYKQALKITRETGEKREEIDLLINMGTSYRYQGELEEEIGCYKQALKIARDTGNSYEEIYILAKLGYEFYYWGDIQKEIERYESAIKIAEERGDKERRGELLSLLGTVYSNQGKHEKAIEYCKEAMGIVQKLSLKEGCLGYLGFAYRCSGNLKNLDEALKHYKQALDIAIKINDRIGEGRRCGSIGIVYSIQGQTEEAIKQYEIALKIAEERKDSGGKGKWLGCMGLAYSDLRKDKEAIEYYKQALEVCRKSGYRRGECEEIGFIGNALSDQGEYEEAIKCYEEALEIAKEIKDEGKEEIWREALRDKQGIWLGTLGLTYSDMGEYEEAIKYYKQALKIAKEIEDKVGDETWLGYMCLAYRTRGMHTEANDYYKKALEISLNIEDKDWKETWLEALGLKYSDLKKDEKALERYQQPLETLKETGNKQRRGIQLGNFDLYPRGAR